MTERSSVPNIEAVRYLSSARDYTEKDKVPGFGCCCRGQADPFLSQRGPRLMATILMGSVELPGSTGKARTDAVIRESNPEAYEA